MAIVAAFLWRKSPKQSISTLIYNSENIKVIDTVKNYFIPKKLFTFRKNIKIIINNYIAELFSLYIFHKKPSVIIEFRIVFNVADIPWMKSARESRLVYSYFIHSVQKLKKAIPGLKLKPQLRNRLTGRAWKEFKRELRIMNLVSRKRDTGYEYYLWAVGLHVTPTTYKAKLRTVKRKLINAFWNEET